MRKLLKPEFLFFLIILLFAFTFRLTNLDLIEFKTDEAVNLILASKLAPGGTVSSIGILNPPLFNYLLAPLTFFTLDPKIFSLFIGLLNSFSIAFFYLITRKYYGQVIAFTSSILFALSPWAIIYSRKIWEQDLLVPFFIILFYSLHKILKEKKEIFYLPLAISSVLLIQLHQIAVFFVILLFIFMSLQRVKLNIKLILIGVVLAGIPLLPYIGYEIKNGYPDFKSLLSSQSRLSSERSLELFIRPLQITNQGNFNFILGSDLEAFIKNFPGINNFRKIFYIEYLLTILGIITYIRKFPEYKLIGYSSIILPFLFFALKIEPFMHYYIIILPLLFLFLGVAFKFLFSSKNKTLRFTSIVLFLSLVGTSLYFNFSFFKLLREKGHFQGDYGDPLRSSEDHIKYKKYNELFLFQFIPLEYNFGYNPFAKMMYADTSLYKIPSLERQLQTSDDPRVQQELLAFYTKEPVNLKTLDILRKKTKRNSKYSQIYKVALEDYMAKNYKKRYMSDKLDLTFFYPQHWKINEDNEIKVDGDNLILNIKRGKSSSIYKSFIEYNLIILGEKAKKIECKKNVRSCGVLYSFKPYSAEVVQKGKDEVGFKNEIAAVDEVLASMRFLSD